MGSMMTGLYVGLSGLRTSSNSLNTTSNNLTNVNTDGLSFNAFIGNGDNVMHIQMESDSDIHGTAITTLYRQSNIVGGGDFNAGYHRIENVSEPTDDSDVATKGYVDKTLGAFYPSLGTTGATVGQFLRVAEVDTKGKPTKWTTDSIANAKGVNF